MRPYKPDDFTVFINITVLIVLVERQNFASLQQQVRV